MSDTPNNQGILGLILLLVILSGQSGSRRDGYGSGLGGAGSFGGLGGLGGLVNLGGLGSLSSLGKTLQLENFARDMHRVVAMMDQVEGLTQMVGVGQLASAASSASQSQSRVSGAANSVSNAFSDTMGALSGQDLNQLMEMAGPLMAMLGKNTNK